MRDYMSVEERRQLAGRLLDDCGNCKLAPRMYKSIVERREVHPPCKACVKCYNFLHSPATPCMNMANASPCQLVLDTMTDDQLYALLDKKTTPQSYGYRTKENMELILYIAECLYIRMKRGGA